MTSADNKSQIYLGEKIFDGAKSDWHEFDQNVQNAAADNEGDYEGTLLHLVYPEIAWLAHVANQYELGILIETDPDTLDVPISANKEIATGQKKLIRDFRTALVAKLHVKIHRWLVTSTGKELHELTIKEIMTALRAHFSKFTVQDIEKIQQPLEQPYTPHTGQLISDYIKLHSDVHYVLRTANDGCHQFSDDRKIAEVKKGIKQCGLYTAEMNAVDDEFRTTMPTFQLWTDRLIELIERSDVQRTTRTAGYASAVAIASTGDTGAITFASQADLTAYYNKRLATETAAAVTNKKSTASNAVSKVSPIVCSHYCWSHGYNNSHASADCKYKKSGHRDEATATNRLGRSEDYPGSGNNGSGRQRKRNRA